MKLILKTLVFSIILFVIVLSGCKNSNPYTPDNSSYNKAVIGNASNSFSYTIDAQHYTYDQKLPIQFDAKSLSIAASVTNFVVGSGNLIIMDSAGTALYDRKLTGPLAAADLIEIFNQPKFVSISFTNFTGKVSINFSGGQ